MLGRNYQTHASTCLVVDRGLPKKTLNLGLKVEVGSTGAQTGRCQLASSFLQEDLSNAPPQPVAGGALLT